MAVISVNVSLGDNVDLPRLLPKLRAAGLRIENSDATLGFVSGSCEEAALAALRALPEVAAIEVAKSFQLPNRGKPVQ